MLISDCSWSFFLLPIFWSGDVPFRTQCIPAHPASVKNTEIKCPPFNLTFINCHCLKTCQKYVWALFFSIFTGTYFPVFWTGGLFHSCFCWIAGDSCSCSLNSLAVWLSQQPIQSCKFYQHKTPSQLFKHWTNRTHFHFGQKAFHGSFISALLTGSQKNRFWTGQLF